jgi:hypothetical protein
MKHLQLTITTLEQELDALDQRRGEIQRAIEILTPLAGDVDEAPAPRRVTKPRKATKNKAATKADGRTDGRSNTRAAGKDRRHL